MAKEIKKIFFDKIEMLSILFFIFGIFLLDVQLNMISVYGTDVKVPFFGGRMLSAVSLFWLGMLVSGTSFILFSVRSIYKKKFFKNWDLFFSILGATGFAIIFAGGLLIVCEAKAIMIPFFDYSIIQIDFYHFGLVLDFIAILYFSLTK